ncbi:hypothetical protein DFH09DRAFT_30896 [Mycena vulgaris]|nr:hypothetical protein DFH09DRAFT_30896 [Mycena vulgaris]
MSPPGLHGVGALWRARKRRGSAALLFDLGFLFLAQKRRAVLLRVDEAVTISVDAPPPEPEPQSAKQPESSSAGTGFSLLASPADKPLRNTPVPLANCAVLIAMSVNPAAYCVQLAAFARLKVPPILPPYLLRTICVPFCETAPPPPLSCSQMRHVCYISIYSHRAPQERPPALDMGRAC